MYKKQILITIAITLVVVIGMTTIYKYENGSQYEPNILEGFAQCITDSGAKFYGAFWCSHCQSQKTAFGSAASLIPYVECSTPDGKGQYPVCAEAQVTSYPTWVFGDGTRQTGALPLSIIAEKTECELPNLPSETEE